MKKFFLCVVVLVQSGLVISTQEVRYKPNWESLDSRPLPEWFDDSKIGIFIHFGVYSVPGFVSEWFWNYWHAGNPAIEKFMKENYPPGFTYQDFARDFTLEFFDPDKWVEIFEKSGARYAVLTSKHHEGYTLYPSKHSFSWNSMDVGPHRDIVGEFEAACRRSSKLHFGLYHSLFEWFNPLYLEDRANNFTTRAYAHTKGTAELYELVKNYKPDLIWSDGDAGPVEYWHSREFLAWLYNESPVKDKVVVNDRWGSGTSCKHGGYLNCADRYNPSGKQRRKWENAMTLDRMSWGYRRNADIHDYLTIRDLLRTMFQTLSNGGNLLVDVGPTKEGLIPLLMQDRLIQMGEFLDVNGEAIYGSSMWEIARKDSLAPDVYYTTNKKTENVYALFIDWPIGNNLVLGSVKPWKNMTIQLLGLPLVSLKWKSASAGGIEINLPEFSSVQWLKNAWVLRISHTQVDISVL